MQTLMRIAVCSWTWCMAACGSSGVTAEEACTTVAQARCDELSMCSAADLSRRFGDATTCETREKLACTESLAAPKTAATPSRTDTCATELAMQACPAFLSGVMAPTDC